MSKLIVAGCSVSDYTQVKKVWGEHLANKTNMNYIHEARGCGSNYRMWRIIASKIIKKEIDSQDVIIVQYTTPERNEFWSPLQNGEPRHLREQLDEGSIIKFKSNSYTFGYKGIEYKFLKLYENFINIQFEEEKFRNNHMMLQTLAKEYNIKNLYFLKLGNYGLNNLPMIPFFENNFIKYLDLFDNPKNHLKGDPGHLSEHGHELLSEMIYKRIFL